MKKYLLISFIILLLFSSLCYSEELIGKCIDVADGDTCTILLANKKRVILRFYGIDAPESKQEFGKESKDYCVRLILGKDIKAEGLYKDKYGRTVAKLYSDNKYINLEMIKAGFAWHYVFYSPNDLDFARAEKEARAKKLGLWIQHNPIEPREYRYQQRQAKKNRNTKAKK